MGILSRFTRVCFSLLVLFALIACGQEPEVKPAPRGDPITWKDVGPKFGELEQQRQQTLDALIKKSQPPPPAPHFWERWWGRRSASPSQTDPKSQPSQQRSAGQ